MATLASFAPRKPFLLCIDSDGCAFDVMELKHKECFCPAYIQHFALQCVSRYAREAWEFANLYSDTRGVHRLPVLVRTLELLSSRRAVAARGFTPPALPGLRAFLSAGQPLNNEALKNWLDEHPADGDVRTTLAWSLDVNERVAAMVRGVPPFPHVRECLAFLHERADIAVVSATQEAALEREWAEHGLARYVSLVCGQESGSKREIIAALAARYDPLHALMIGDAPGDAAAARAGGALFYPIRPEEEAQSWAECSNALSRFFAGTYAGAYEKTLRERFDRLLPHEPAWETVHGAARAAASLPSR